MLNSVESPIANPHNLICQSKTHQHDGGNVDDELSIVYKVVIAGAAVTVASSEIITSRKRNKRRIMWVRETIL